MYCVFYRSVFYIESDGFNVQKYDDLQSSGGSTPQHVRGIDPKRVVATLNSSSDDSGDSECEGMDSLTDHDVIPNETDDIDAGYNYYSCLGQCYFYALFYLF